MGELIPDLLRRVLVVMQFDNCDGLFWRVDDDELSIHVTCSDFFAWGGSDCESIETEADVELLEQARADLVTAGGDPYPMWIGELYATRRRQQRPAEMMLAGGKYALNPKIEPLFTDFARRASRTENGDNQ